jgi:hypothetical protein
MEGILPSPSDANERAAIERPLSLSQSLLAHRP